MTLVDLIVRDKIAPIPIIWGDMTIPGVLKPRVFHGVEALLWRYLTRLTISTRHGGRKDDVN